ncbi:diguanylate cyclase/phosphodiesterase with PAS/PAC sensor(s) [Nitrosomonas sp. Is79A3]|uniref:EAL domain-containing protein n=1 Tax=Nitrosomonas sp. (strain Is79A3) TaxID=261292 RepID=UPI000215CD24
MDLRNKLVFLKKIWFVIAMFLLLYVSFYFYVNSERLVDRANNQRLISFQLTDELRRTSDDLTRMARTYVATSDLRFKGYFQDILDIRDGKQPRPAEYSFIYWDLVTANSQLRRVENGQAISLLDLMRQTSFVDNEFEKMHEAKIHSDNLAELELNAMRLIETASYSDMEFARAKAMQMLHDENYHQVKAMIMAPINESYKLVRIRTQTAIDSARDNALIFRIIFITVTLSTTIILWRFYVSLSITLGSSAKEIHALIRRIGQGDFNTSIPVLSGMENSVLADLLDMQRKLYIHENERKEAEEKLCIAAICFESQEAMMITDVRSNILRVNQAFTKSTGYTSEEVIGKTPRILQSGRHNNDFYREMWKVIKRTGGWQGEIWDRRKNGEVYPKWLTISAVKGSDGAVTHYVAMHSDITEHKNAEKKIQKLAFFDQLTDLPNRFLLNERITQAMLANIRSNNHGALLFIDLDNFKSLNDTLGHNKGDLLLKQVAQRLITCVRAGDTVARLGGDEFIMLLTNLNENESDSAIHVGNVCKKILTTLNQTYQLDTISHHSTASIGVTLFNGLQSSIEDLMKQADLAMYKSKEMGRNTFHFFDQEMEAIALKRATFEKDFQEGINKNQFLLYYQAQMNSDMFLLGAEALVRWQHPKYGIVSPAEFIPLAEETGLILPLGHRVLETACYQLSTWANQPKMAHLTISVNVSARQFHQEDFVGQVLAILKNTGANPRRLKLELTESLLISNVDEIIKKMFALRAEGVGFSLDDFGTGFSSLSYLKRLPLDQLKIDRSFVRDVLTDHNDASIAKAIIVLAQNLDLSVIAEGVETEAQRDFLAKSGCHAYQGYLFGKPLPIESFEQLLQKKNIHV